MTPLVLGYTCGYHGHGSVAVPQAPSPRGEGWGEGIIKADNCVSVYAEFAIVLAAVAIATQRTAGRARAVRAISSRKVERATGHPGSGVTALDRLVNGRALD